MKQISLFIALLSFGALQNARADSETSSESKSCSGDIVITKDGVQTHEKFHINTFQMAFVNNGLAEQESHIFLLPDFLGPESNYKMRKKPSQDHIIYESDKFLIAVPWRNNASLEIVDLSDKSIPGPEERRDFNRPKWQKLCD